MCADSLSGCRRAVAFYAFFAAFRLAAQNFFIRKPTAFLASADILPPPMEQFDAGLHIDQTTAIEPLERWAFDEVDLPETYPSGI